MDRNKKAEIELRTEDFEARCKSFLEEYKALTEKYEVDYANYPMWIPGEKGTFQTIVQNTPVDLRLKKLNDSFIAK